MCKVALRTTWVSSISSRRCNHDPTPNESRSRSQVNPERVLSRRIAAGCGVRRALPDRPPAHVTPNTRSGQINVVLAAHSPSLPLPEPLPPCLYEASSTQRFRAARRSPGAASEGKVWGACGPVFHWVLAGVMAITLHFTPPIQRR